jgi:hypothetical protein
VSSSPSTDGTDPRGPGKSGEKFGEDKTIEIRKILERIDSQEVPDHMRGPLRKTFRWARKTIGSDQFAEKVDNLVASQFPGTTLETLGNVLLALAPEVYLDPPLSARPTRTPPGPDTEPTGRIAVYRQRHRRGKSLHHPEDLKLG